MKSQGQELNLTLIYYIIYLIAELQLFNSSTEPSALQAELSGQVETISANLRHLLIVTVPVTYITCDITLSKKKLLFNSALQGHSQRQFSLASDGSAIHNDDY
jgi:hypothetical protein